MLFSIYAYIYILIVAYIFCKCSFMSNNGCNPITGKMIASQNISSKHWPLFNRIRVSWWFRLHLWLNSIKDFCFCVYKCLLLSQEKGWLLSERMFVLTRILRLLDLFFLLRNQQCATFIRYKIKDSQYPKRDYTETNRAHFFPCY